MHNESTPYIFAHLDFENYPPPLQILKNIFFCRCITWNPNQFETIPIFPTFISF